MTEKKGASPEAIVRDIERQKRHHGPAAGDVAGGVSALDGQQHTDHDDRR